jgi:hypothetical protein
VNALLVHDEMLSVQTLERCADDVDLRIFVFDPVWMEQERWSLKRIQFVCDALVELGNVRVFKAEIRQVVVELQITRFTTLATPNAHWQKLLMRAGVPFSFVEPVPFVQASAPTRRFMAYWKVAERELFDRLQ